MSIRVLIAEDQSLLRQCFKEVLERSGEVEVVGTAADGLEAVDLAEKHSPDVVLMDLEMPRLDGIGAAELLRDRVPSARVLILSLHDSEDEVDRAIRAGVYAYVLKNVDLGELVRIIEAVHTGKEIVSPFLADQRMHRVPGLRRYGLTLREGQVLKLLVEGFNNHEIADQLCLSEDTIKKELNSIFDKMRVKNRTQAAVKGIRLGLGT